MLPRAFLLLVLLPFALLPACQSKVESGAPGAGHGDEPCAHAEAEGEEKAEACTHGAEGTKLENPEVAKVNEGGTEVLVAGAKIGASGEAVEVAVEALLDAPEEYAGKLVRVTGDVSAMCHHERAWFTLVAPDKSGRNLRVLTVPSFLVPQGVIGMNASTEGVVELIEVPEAEARHYAKEHKLGDPEQIVGPQKRAIIRAAGAAFRKA